VRFLGVGETNDLGDMYLRLAEAGHEVKVFMSDEDSAGVMEGMLDFVSNWRAELDWIREAGIDGVILFETASSGETQDALRKEGFNVVGGSAFGDKLEQDRPYGQQILRDLGLKTAATREFAAFDEALTFLSHSKGRYVLKLNGSNWPSTSSYVGQMEDAADMIALLVAMRNHWTLDESPSFVLMDHIEGVEAGVGAFFNGEQFLDPPNLDWEHKRFFPGDIGELTGEMGTIVTYRGAEKLFDATLARLAPLLAASGYCGYINLNMILNDAGAWPLELTCRFGYPGFTMLDSLHDEDWSSIFATLTRRDRLTLRTKDGYSAGVVLTVPSFPYSDGYAELGKGTPICFRDTMSENEYDSLHFGEVTSRDGQLLTAGMIGYVMVVTARGEDVEQARKAVYETVKKVVIPNARFRNDIGLRLIEKDLRVMSELGWM